LLAKGARLRRASRRANVALEGSVARTGGVVGLRVRF
jgi:hypothetical protein